MTSPEATKSSVSSVRAPASPPALAALDALDGTVTSQDVFDRLQEGVALFDQDDRLALCNHRYRALFPALEDIIAPGVAFETLARAAAQWDAQRDAERDTDRDSERRTGADLERWVKRRLATHRRQSGTFLYDRADGTWLMAQEQKLADGLTLTTYFDITAMKRREGELETARSSADIASRANSDFLANVSHELRTPINAILGFSEVIMRELYGDVGNGKYVAYSQDIHFCATYLLELINSLLDLSKIEARSYELNERLVEVDRLIEDSLRLVGQQAEDGDLTIHREQAEDLPDLQADELVLRQILVNLLSNAIKFTPRGGSLTLSAELDAERNLEVTVSDTGIGMRPEDIPRVLMPFVRV